MSELRWILLIAGLALIVALYLLGTRNRQRPPTAEFERGTRIDPPRPAPASEAARLEPRMSLGEARSEPAADAVGAASSLGLPDPPLEPPLRRESGLVARPDPPLRAGPPIRPDSIVRPEAGTGDTGAVRRGSDTVAPLREEQAARSDARPTATAPRSPQKIVAIRVTAAHPARFDGALLREVVTAARFTHGRYEIYHRLGADGRPVMSLASLLEPGTFDPTTMDSAAYPGIAIFTVMPGPLPAARAFDELLDTARGLAHRLGGQLQDDRGAPLTVQRVFKLREEVVAFERSLGSAGRV